jgi:hypothetical protein
MGPAKALAVREPEDVTEIVPVEYGFSRDPWYTKVVELGGRVIHYGPWATLWAATHASKLLRLRFKREGRLHE